MHLRNIRGSLFRAAITSGIFAFSSLPSASADVARPKLVVQITADQLRGDLLDRYRSVLTHGFSRIETGYWFHRGDVNHGLTLSFPGHTTLATGLNPSHHGLTGNEWWVQRKDGSWGEEEVVLDDAQKTIADPAAPGVSPHYLLATTLGEWIKSADPKARSVALGTGTRIPIAYGGHRADAVYWYDTNTNAFTTSTYYADRLAPWIASFNKNELPKFEPPAWALSVPANEVSLADPDATPTENDGRNNVFPHVYAAESVTPNTSKPESYGDWYTNTPLKDEALFALAAKAVEAEQLGQRGVTDYLAIDIDSTDNVGHMFGPESLEQLDTLMRLDRAMGAFLDRLDHMVGKGNYVLAFSADHGVTSRGEPGVRQVSARQIDALLDRVESVAKKPHESDAALQTDIVATLKSADFVADAYTEPRLMARSDDPYVGLYRNMLRPGYTTDFPLWSSKPRPYHPARYHIIVRFKENTITDLATAIHGSPYAKDRLVPIIFYGAGIRRGSAATGARTVDVAPTLAAAAGIAAPKNLDGRALSGALAPAP